MMTQQPISGLIMRLGVPTMISMFVTTLYNMADSYFVGQINTSASGATSVVMGLMAILQAIGFMFNATFLSSLRNGLCFIPILLILSIVSGLHGIQIAQAIADVMTCLACIPFTVSFFRKISRDAVE